MTTMSRLAHTVARLAAESQACGYCGSVPTPRWDGSAYVLECPVHPDAGINERRRRRTR